jgi:predicted DNA-binding transcriptional regulator YafY
MLPTSVRLLRLLQAPDGWTAPQLAEKLGVTTRTIRKDIERLRGLDYPVHAIPGTAGGYRAGPGAAMPVPGPVPGVVPGPAPALDAAALTIIATACRDREQLRFDYTSQDGASSYRIVEPYRLVRARSHWYLLAWDTDRRDWRTFRADRIRPRSPNGPQFARRDSPDDSGAAARVLTGLDWATWRCQARVTVHASADVIIQQLPPAITVEPLDEHTCMVSAGSDTPQILAAYLGMFDADFEVSEPPELVEHIRTLAGRYKRAIAKAPLLSAPLDSDGPAGRDVAGQPRSARRRRRAGPAAVAGRTGCRAGAHRPIMPVSRRNGPAPQHVARHLQGRRRQDLLGRHAPRSVGSILFFPNEPGGAPVLRGATR